MPKRCCMMPGKRQLRCNTPSGGVESTRAPVPGRMPKRCCMTPSTLLMPAHCGGSASPYPRTRVLKVMSSGSSSAPAAVKNSLSRQHSHMFIYTQDVQRLRIPLPPHQRAEAMPSGSSSAPITLGKTLHLNVISTAVLNDQAPAAHLLHLQCKGHKNSNKHSNSSVIRRQQRARPDIRSKHLTLSMRHIADEQGSCMQRTPCSCMMRHSILLESPAWETLDLPSACAS